MTPFPAEPVAPEPLRDSADDAGSGVSRRRLLGVSGTAAVAGVVAGATGAYAVTRADDAERGECPDPCGRARPGARRRDPVPR